MSAIRFLSQPGLGVDVLCWVAHAEEHNEDDEKEFDHLCQRTRSLGYVLRELIKQKICSSPSDLL